MSSLVRQMSKPLATSFSESDALANGDRFAIFNNGRLKAIAPLEVEGYRLDYLLVDEDIDVSSLRKTTEGLASRFSRIHIAFHTNGTFKQASDFMNFPENCIPKKGMHSKGDLVYQAAVKFILGDDKAYSNGIDVFEGNSDLKTKIALLHQLLLPDNAQVDKIPEALLDDYKNFEKAVKGITLPLDDRYVTALANLRSHWLGSTP